MEPLRIEIGAATGVEVAPDLWGLFFEDINTSLDGGLNAELVRNGDFEFTEMDHPGWNALTGWSVTGDGSVQLRDEDPVHPNNSRYLRAVGPVRLVNEGWDGVGISAGQAHRLSLATWSVFGGGDLTASVIDEAETVLATTSVALPEQGWNWVEADLVGAADGRGQFTLEVPAGLTVELDVISLRPLDQEGRVLTFRPDLLQVLKDLAPSFVRFPGGCVAHGAGLANMYRWKPTVGPRHTREQIRNVWGYHQSRQIGYQEFFELCDELGATALPVLPAGVCCQNVRGGAVALPQDQMDDYIAEVLDLIEFGKPYGLRYLGIGNEDAITDAFRDRYAQIEDAVRARYPEITIVGTVGPFPFGPDWEAGWEFARQRGTDIVDEHAYRTPRWFHQNVDRYDSYERGGPGVYFGEYAARSNSLRSALSEAAFMVGMERNSEVVKLASYAPLLARVGATQWVPDLIYFTADQVLPSASYFVQQMFARQRGTALRHIEVTGADPVPVTIPSAGTARVTSPGAVFELSDIVIDGVARADASTSDDGSSLHLADIDPGQAVIELTVRRTAGDRGLHLRLGGEGSESFIELDVPNWTGRETVINRYDDGISNDDNGPFPWRSLGADERLPIKIELDGARVRARIDGELRHDYDQDLRPEQRVVVGAASRSINATAADEYVVRVVNATDQPRQATVVLPDVTAAVTGTATVLAGDDPDVGAPFQPSPAEPNQVEVSGQQGSVEITLPAWSFTVAVLGEDI